MKVKIGFGFDVHAFSAERECWLGGVKIPSTVGILGHSDADVLLHAISDAVLGACALGDIGVHFPPSNNDIKGIDSKIILNYCLKLAEDKGFVVGNLDCTLVAEQPKVMPHALSIRESIAKLCKVSMDDVSVKATTNEKMGFIGRKEGLVAYAAVLMVSK